MFKLFKKKPVPKGDPKAGLLSLLIRPGFIQNHVDAIQINDKFNRVILAAGYPGRIREGWLNSIVSSEGNFDLAMHVSPQNPESVLVSLNQELVKQESDLNAAQKQGSVNPSLKIKYSDTLKVLENLHRGEEKLFDLSLYVNAKASNREELELLSSKVRSELNSMGIVSKAPYLRMQDAVKSVFPLLDDRLRVSRNIPSAALSACFPFTSSFLRLDENGIMFGVNQENNVPIIVDVCKLRNQNGIVLGGSGGGKSYAIKVYILRALLNGIKINIIDPQGEYDDLVKTLKGQIVEISKDSDTIINPLDLLGHDYGEKVLSLMDLFRIIMGELTIVQKNILDRVIHKTYRLKGITANDPTSWRNEPPLMDDLVHVLQEEKELASRLERVTYEALETRLRMYSGTGSLSFFNRHTSLDLENRLVSFNIKSMPGIAKPVMMFLILDYIVKQMQRDRERKFLVVDEAWSLLRHGEHAEYLFELIKTARKYGLGLIIITQEVNDLLNTKAGEATLANTAWKLLMGQEPSVIDLLAEKFKLHEEEKNYLLTAQIGEGLLFLGSEHLPIKVVASEKEHELITTNPDEVRVKEGKVVLEREKEWVSLVGKKKFFLKSELSVPQLNYLKGNGFVEARLPDLGLGRGSSYVVAKPNGSEGLDHFFLGELIAEELRKHTDQVWTWSRDKPDVEFLVPPGRASRKELRVAFEVETGTLLDNPRQLARKVEILKEGYDLFYFVVTDSALKDRYEKATKAGCVLTRIEVADEIKAIFERTDWSKEAVKPVGEAILGNQPIG